MCPIDVLRPAKKVFDYQKENEFFSVPIKEIKDYPWMVDDLRRWLPNPEEKLKNKKVLEIGASEGALAAAVVSSFDPELYVALDIVQRRLIGASRLSEKIPTLVPIAGSAFVLPFKNATFDIILNNGTLNHLPQMQIAVAEFARVLKPAGEYFGREPNGHNLLVRWISAYSRRASPNAIPVLEPEVKSAFELAGFDIRTDFFWRRLPSIKNRYLAVSLRIHARKPSK